MKVKLICQWCGKEYFVFPCLSETRKYCSCDCKNKAHSRLMKGEGNSNYGNIKHTLKKCPICGKMFNPAKPSVKFCSKKCYYESKYKIQICKNCGNGFKILKSLKGIKFCSKKCRHEYYQNRYYETKECLVCGKKFSALKSKKRVCCSVRCAAKYIESKVAIKCKECGKTFFKKLSKSGKTHFCSKRCYSKWCIENWRGDNNHNWRGGSSRYRGENWIEQRTKARERDNHTCQNCGTDSDLQVHHIIPFKFFDNYIEANRLKYLKTLCRKCHGKEEAKIRSKAEQLRQKLSITNLPDLLGIIKTWFKEENGILVWR